LSDVAESPRLADKMKYVFGRSRGEDELFAKLMRDLCFTLRISLSKKCRLVAELEALGEQEGAAKPFEHMKEIVARDAVTLDHMDDGFMEGDINEQNSDYNGDSSTVEVVPETSLDESVDSKKQKSNDPFNIYPLLNKDGIIMNDMTNGEKSSLKFPPGFTPDQVDVGSIGDHHL
ncbi:hypothetical protein Tco_0177419, partial [Tanacetum coccineum]